jgi:MoaA/NifB/PqqE/SkfB family radical SAM enzyme
MDGGRLTNVLSLVRAFERGEADLEAGPVEAYFEVASRCNLRCPMCPIVVDPRHASGSGQAALLSPGIFERLGPTFRRLQRAHLFGLGEPLLSPHLFHYVSRLAAAGVETWITTNATLMTDARADALARAGLTRATASIDGATKETYERIRVGGRFEEAVRGIRALTEARRRWGRPRVMLTMVGMASNLRELPQLVDLCAECGADGVFVERLYHYPHPDLEAVYAREDLAGFPLAEADRIFAEAESRARHHGLEFSFRPRPRPPARARTLLEAAPRSPSRPPASPSGGAPASLPFPCSEPWKTINVSADGEVRTCCFNHISFGNVAKTPFDEIWDGDSYRRLRGDHAAGLVPPGCARCVGSGRVMRSPLFPPSFPAPPAPVPEADGVFSLESPAAGEPVGDELLLAGTLPEAGPPLGRRFVDVFIDAILVARVAARKFRRRFAASIPIPYVTEGHHVVRARIEDARGPQSAIERPIQVARLDTAEGDITAVEKAVVGVEITRREPAPSATCDQRPWPVADWACGRSKSGFLGIAILDVRALTPGPHDLELVLRRRREKRRLLILGPFRKSAGR